MKLITVGKVEPETINILNRLIYFKNIQLIYYVSNSYLS